jgi:hypothetical protein
MLITDVYTASSERVRIPMKNGPKTAFSGGKAKFNSPFSAPVSCLVIREKGFQSYEAQRFNRCI